MVNKEKRGNISHFVQFNAVKINSGTGPFWPYMTPESYLLGYALTSCSTLKNLFSYSIVPSQLGFQLDPFHIRKKEVPATCI